MRHTVDSTIAYLALAQAQAAKALANGTAPALKQQTWFVDPSNSSGQASSSNDGLTPLTPISRFSQLFQRWGTNAPTFVGVKTTVALMSNGILDGSDTVDLRPTIGGGGNFLLTGIPQQVAAGTFGVVTPQNRATGQRYTATVSDPGNTLPANWWAQWVGMLVNDTTTNAWFWVLNDLGVKTATFTRPKATSIGSLAPPLLTIGGGDGFIVYDLPKIDLVRFSPTNFPCSIQHISTEGAGLLTHYDGDVTITECRMVVREPSVYDGGCFAANCFASGPDNTYGAGIFGAISGVISAFDGHAVQQGGTIFLDGDVYCDDKLFASNAQIICGLAWFASLKVPNGQADTFAGAGASLLVLPYFYGSAALWGPCVLQCSPGGDVVYQGAAVGVFMNTGGIQIDGVGTASSYDGAGTWHGGIALNPANLDAAAGAAGFGGCAYGIKGSKIHQWV